MIKTALSHPNKALVIYWGNENDTLRIPTRSSLSITLQGINHPLDYIVSLRTMRSSERDKVIIDGIEDKGEIHNHFVHHLEAMRRYTGFKEKVEVTTRKSFPVGSGLAGSAASASALAEAFAGLINKTADTKLKSILARRGSGSASRSVFGGFVMWHKGNSDDSSYAKQLFNENHWDLRNVIAMVSSNPKKIRSIEGMKLSKKTCPGQFYSEFVRVANPHIEQLTTALSARDIAKLGLS
jgi:diphosphomevalonate decarboxylase